MKRGILIGAILLGTFANAEVNLNICSNAVELSNKNLDIASNGFSNLDNKRGCEGLKNALFYTEIAIEYCPSQYTKVLLENYTLGKSNQSKICVGK